jgi:L-ascorbate metabolism protein UlaG (beta-lactamase superfamily)
MGRGWKTDFLQEVQIMKSRLPILIGTILSLGFLAGCSQATAAPTLTPTPTLTATPAPTSTPAGAPVLLEYIGHACFLLTAGDGTRIVMDPYNSNAAPPEIAKFPPNIVADIVTVSHFHPDHAGISGVGGKPRPIFQPGPDQAGAVKITGYKSDHGYTSGVPAGDNTIFVFEVAGVKIVHMGAAGVITQSDILAAIENADVVMIDAMGTDSHPVPEMMAQLRKSNVRTIIPTHNSFSDATLYYGSITVDEFVKLLTPDEVVNRMDGSSITVTPGMPVQVLILKPSALSAQK